MLYYIIVLCYAILCYYCRVIYGIFRLAVVVTAAIAAVAVLLLLLQMIVVITEVVVAALNPLLPACRWLRTCLLPRANH